MPPAPAVAAPQRIDPQRQPWPPGGQHPGPQQPPRLSPHQETDPHIGYDWQGVPGQDYDAATDAHPLPERGEFAEHASDTDEEPRPRRDHTADAGAPKRGKKPLVTTLVLLLLLGAAGGTAAVPDVANRLALPWAPNAPERPPPEPLAVRRSLIGPEQAVGAPSPAGVSAALEKAASSSALGTLSGSVVDPVTDKVLWQQDAGKPLPPASTTKLLTSAAALLSVDHTATLTTSVVEGPEPGSVVLVAGGDPTLSSASKGEATAYTDAARLDDLVKQVRKSAGDVSTVYLDTSAYEGGSRASGWVPGDAPSTYAAPIEPGMLDGGRTDPYNDESMRIGDPAGALADEFADRLGAKVGGSAGSTARGAKVIGEVHSAPLPVLIEDLLTESDNVLAEAVARQVAIANDKPPSFDGAATATKQVLSDAGFDVSGVTLDDGSGLSSDNAIPATLLSDILAAAAGKPTDPTTAKLRPLLAGLPVAGGTGTLDDRYLGSGAQGKGWVRAKTGTLSGVNTLAGVVLTKSGRVLVFSLMSSGTNPLAARPALDAVASSLRGCGCR
ncbi:MAG: D-alanyl-D-alanine carboxypeptidase/D-alanyl-D-alanine-endopeptidase [Actinophytocola sp.]|nr:D-alanyl-D-alanine carboxypeptidase/D-alanyl-D-alanine-endopeptidase [Actinophytocola sp.]